MIIKNLLYFILVVFLSGCTQTYSITSTKQLDAIDKRINEIEQNINQKLDTKEEEQIKAYEKLLESSLLLQNENIESLKKELTTLIKPEKLEEVKVEKTEPRPIIIQKKITSLNKKLVVGSVEKVHIYPSNFVMEARIDTGAETSSIDARDIVKFERDGQKWVRFTIVDRNTNTPYIIERKIARAVKILQSSLENEHEKRVVVTLKITIGDKKELSEFTLTNRAHMQYPMLIGRNTLQDVMVVDVSEEYIAPLIIDKEQKLKK